LNGEFNLYIGKVLFINPSAYTINRS